MIFVTVGTNEARFDRLLHAVESLEFDDVVVQCGSSSFRPKNATCFDFLAFERLVEYVRSASAVVTHAGVGSIAVTLANGRRPIVVPRLQRYGEAVDDHQVALARRLERSGLVTLVEDPAQLRHFRFDVVEPPPSTGDMSSALADDLSQYLHGLVSTERQGFSRRRNAATVNARGGERNWLRPR
jgi:UDP-N-acetylglucosamine transferase subunit ALG13